MASTTRIFLTALLAFTLSFQARADQSEPLSLGPFEVMPSDGGAVEFGMGFFNVFRDREGRANENAGAANVEYRFGNKFYYLGLTLGAAASVDGSAIFYLGNYADIRFGRHYFLTPVLSVGAYRTGGGKDLGGTLQFRSAVTLAYEMKDKSRIGVRFAHTSNADLHDENPGMNEFFLTYSFHF